MLSIFHTVVEPVCRILPGPSGENSCYVTKMLMVKSQGPCNLIVWAWILVLYDHGQIILCLSFLIVRMEIVFATESFCGDIATGNNGKGISSQKADLGPARWVLLYCQARKFSLFLFSRIWYILWCNVHLVLSLSVSCAGVFIVVIVFFLTSKHQV